VIYIYRPAVSEGGRALEDALNDIGVPARFSQGKLIRERFRAERDKIVCWGAKWSGAGADTAVNNVDVVNKFTEATRLQAGGVRTVQVSRVRPADRPAVRGDFIFDSNTVRLSEQQARDLTARIQAYLDAPLPPAETWVARRNAHVGGDDLREGIQAGDFYSRKEPITSEYRVHIWKGKSIRAGQKVKRDGFETTAHPWIRSYESGWRVNYSEFKSSKAMRELAAKAVETLGLTFGAVDLGELADGSLLVLEVNRAPGIEGGTTGTYAERIKTWVETGE
jgi:hypothetical protein